ncbi:family 78 glycoside hydrolase catalytic domain [Streptomyces scopuliridis]|uniref:family 78 glycoside hydrolase catalytic domain n=1 Tax=Streptomyces scopuliridis TaxID=452529 RepID=UPI00367FF0DB
MTPPTRVVQTFKPVKETTLADGQRVYDFGQNRTGWSTLQAAAPADTKVDIKQGEILDTNGEGSTSKISFAASDLPRQTNYYTFNGSGQESYTPHFNYADFHYAKITGLPSDAKVTMAAQAVHTDAPAAGSFSTSDPRLNQIQSAVSQTQLNDLESISVDCPTRERHGRLGDAGDTDQEEMSTSTCSRSTTSGSATSAPAPTPAAASRRWHPPTAARTPGPPIRRGATRFLSFLLGTVERRISKCRPKSPVAVTSWTVAQSYSHGPLAPSAHERRSNASSGTSARSSRTCRVRPSGSGRTSVLGTAST